MRLASLSQIITEGGISVGDEIFPVSVRIGIRLVGTAGADLRLRWSCQEATPSSCPVAASAVE